MNTLTKIIISVFVLAFTFGVFSYITGNDFLTKTADAWGSTCGDCGSSSDDDDKEGSVCDKPSDPCGLDDDDDDDDKPKNYPAKCVSFTANKTTVPYGGGNVTLNWSTQKAQGVAISGIGNVVSNGSKTVFVDSDTTFTLTAKSNYGNDNCNVSITVEDPELAAKCDYFHASRNSVPYNGANVTLDWGTTDATSVSISGIGNVSADGSKTVFVDSNTTFTLTANGAGGDDDCAVTITVGDKPSEEAPICNYFRVDGDSRVEKGDEITLEWETTDADYVSISPNIGSVPRDGEIDVIVKKDTTFTLTARNTDNKETDCTVRVKIDDDYEPRDKLPRCDMEVSDRKVFRGEIVTLSWETDRAERVRVRDNHGHTLFDTDDYSYSERKDYFDGELDVRINKDTKFQLLVDGNSGDVDCDVKVYVDDLAVYEKRDQGMVIALTQVPYTGFEAGPFLTFMFYAMLTLWALFISYILVIKKGSVLGFALYKQGAATENDISNRKKVEALVAKYSHRK